MKDLARKYKYEFLIAACVLGLCVIPLLFGKIYTGHDFSYHFGRIRCLADNIQHGEWFSPVYFSGLYDAGYASPAFYGDLFLYIPALAVCAGIPEELAFRLFIMLITAAAAYSAYWCGKKGFQNPLAAFVCAVCFVFSPYFSVDAYTRTALGELQAFIFLPFVALGFYSILFKDGKYRLCLSLGMVGLLISHVLSAAVSVFIMAVLALVYIKRLIKESRRFYMLVTSAALFFGISASFIIPLLEQLSTGEFVLTNGMSAVRWGTLAGRSMPWYAVFSDFCMGSEATGAWIPNGLGLMPVIAMAFCGIYWFKSKVLPRFQAIMLILGVFTLFCTTSLFPWSYLQSLCGSMQFPWRLLSFATGFFALLAGSVVLHAQEYHAQKAASDGKKATKKQASVLPDTLLYIFVMLALAGTVFSYANTASGPYKNMLKKASSGDEVTPYRTMIGAGEYLRMTEDTVALDSKGKASSNADLVTGIKSVLSKNSKKIASNNLKQSSLKLTRGYGELTAEFSGNTAGDTYIVLPLINYKGYAAYINGVPAEITDGALSANVTLSKTEYAVTYGAAVRVELGGAESGTVTVRYEGTSLQLLGRLITLATAISAAAYLITKKVRSRSQTRTPAK